MTRKLPFLFACAGALVARSAVADPPPRDADVPPLTPPTTPVDPVSAPPPDPVPTIDPTAPISDVPPAPQPTPTTVNIYTQDTQVITDDRPGPYSYAWRDPYLYSGIGIGFAVGGGVSGFTDKAMRDTVSTQVGGLWGARVSFGTHIPIGLDIGYTGTAANINSINGSANGTLIGTTLEAALRYNILPHYTVNPYLFAGAGWQRYDVQDIQFSQADSGMASKDNVAEFPMGVGLGVRDVSGFNFDLRGTFRATMDSTLLQESTGNYAALHTWEASGAVGYEF